MPFTHVTPVCTNVMGCAMMESFYSGDMLENLILGFGLSVVVVAFMVAISYIQGWRQNRKRRNRNY